MFQFLSHFFEQSCAKQQIRWCEAERERAERETAAVSGEKERAQAGECYRDDCKAAEEAEKFRGQHKEEMKTKIKESEELEKSLEGRNASGSASPRDERRARTRIRSAGSQPPDMGKPWRFVIEEAPTDSPIDTHVLLRPRLFSACSGSNSSNRSGRSEQRRFLVREWERQSNPSPLVPASPLPRHKASRQDQLSSPVGGCTMSPVRVPYGNRKVIL